MNIRKTLAITLAVLMLGGCSPKGTSETSKKKPEKKEETSSSPEPSETPLSMDHTKLADKKLGIDYKLLEKIPLDGEAGKTYAQTNGYENDLDDDFYSPDKNAFEIIVTDPDYSWLKETYTYASQTSNPYLDQVSGSMTVMISGEEQYENSEGYYPDTVEAFKKNLTDAGYQSVSDNQGTADASGYQVNYYNYSNGGRLFSITEVLLNGEFSTGVIEVGNQK